MFSKAEIKKRYKSITEARQKRIYKEKTDIIDCIYTKIKNNFNPFLIKKIKSKYGGRGI